MDPAWTRREVLRLGGLSALSFLAGPLWGEPARAGEGGDGARALIFLWLDGGPSQLETFDPKPGARIGGPTDAIPTRIPGVSIGADYPRLAERLDRVSLIRSLVTEEGEHERGRTVLHTGYAPSPTAHRPSIGAVVAHEREAPEVEIPRHVAILSRAVPRGGYLGGDYDAFAVGDPADPIQDLESPVGDDALDRRLADLVRLEEGFLAGRRHRVRETDHLELARRARRMMASEQMAAFRSAEEPAAVREAYGDTPFGRGCLVARRLVETGVPAVEVSLGGWDSHAANFATHQGLAPVLDQAFAALLDDLEERDMLRSTVVLCGGEFGRTPRINGLDGRDHHTRGFSYLVGGGGLRPGAVIGETDPEGVADPTEPVTPQDLYATVLQTLAIDGGQEFVTDAGRPVRLNEGAAIRKLLPG